MTEPLNEKDFIPKNNSVSPLIPWWLWGAIASIVFLFIYSSTSWFDQLNQEEVEGNPFAQVTNREFSIFLWQFPSYLKAHVKKKSGYLTEFEMDRPNFNPQSSNAFVVAPPDLLFLYHTWKRLLEPDFISQPIPGAEFVEFLDAMPEWQAKAWKEAPKEYGELISSDRVLDSKDLAAESFTALPLSVRQAFQGWKNYFKEGDEINKINPTVSEIQAFLDVHPHYARSFWRNIDEIVGQEVAGKNYLLILEDPLVDGTTIVPKEQISSFLRVAFFNFH